MRISNLFFGALAYASLVCPQNVTHCTGGTCYVVNVPASTASTGTGDIFFQISGPTTMSWIGLGQGSGMTGANIFFVYANTAGTNVTLSPRMGVGEREPTIDTAASVILLSGSGIANGIMTANVKCSNCNSWSGGSMSFTDANSEWIWAYKSGASISSDSLSVNCPQHSNFGTTTFNLQSAAGGDSANPFTNTAALSSTASSSSGMSGSNTSISSNFANIRLTHGIMASVAFVIFMPLGAIIIRTLSFKNLIWVHASWMVFAYLMALAALGMGVWMAVTVDELNSAHAIIGIVVIGGVLLQPVTGLVHHLSYKRYGSPNAATYTHLWWGRAIITLAIINGGLGVQLAAPYLANLKTGEIIYGVVAGVMWLIWVAVIAIAFMKSRSGKEDETEECMFSNTSDGESRALRG